MIVSEYIPKNRMRQFHDILCATDGRYIGNPRDCGDTVYVKYSPGDWVSQHRAWRNCIEDVRVIQKNQRWRTMYRRFIHAVKILSIKFKG